MPGTSPTAAARAATGAGLALLSACGLGTHGSTLEVAVASSLRDVLPAILDGDAGDGVRLSFSGSQAVAAQIRLGAPIDLIVTADETTWARLARQGLVGEAVPIAGNRLAVAVAPGNPGGVESVEDLARDGVSVVLAAPQVPLGRATDAWLGQIGLRISPRARLTSAAAVVTTLQLGEADAAVVYATDLKGAGSTEAGAALEGFAIIGGPVTRYLAAVVIDDDPDDDEALRRLLETLTSADAISQLRAAGFEPPPK